MSGDRCLGHCCRNFPLSIAFDLLKQRAQQGSGEAAFVADMLVVLQTEPEPRYTCRHLLPSGDCGVYEQRPSMCRDYPYGRGCDYAECASPSMRSQRSLPLVLA